jgi:hypothetical protein
MGFLDKVKGTAKQAVTPGQQRDTRDKIMRLNQNGVMTTATLVSMQELGQQLGGGRETEFVLEVDPVGGGEPYPATVRQSMMDGATRDMGPGSRLSVKVDPEDPQSLLVWGGA